LIETGVIERDGAIGGPNGGVMEMDIGEMSGGEVFEDDGDEIGIGFVDRDIGEGIILLEPDGAHADIAAGVDDYGGGVGGGEGVVSIGEDFGELASENGGGAVFDGAPREGEFGVRDGGFGEAIEAVEEFGLGVGGEVERGAEAIVDGAEEFLESVHGFGKRAGEREWGMGKSLVFGEAGERGKSGLLEKSSRLSWEGERERRREASAERWESRWSRMEESWEGWNFLAKRDLEARRRSR